MADHGETLHLQETELVCLVPEGSSLTGVLTSETAQQLVIHGHYSGRIELSQASRLVIAEGAQVEAENIYAHTIVVHGSVDGKLHGHVIELGATARVKGSVTYQSVFASKPGARVRAMIEGPDEE